MLNRKFFTAVFLLLFLATALSAGYVHNHTDDPFHTQEHKTCPVSVWAHTPFANGVVAPQVVFVAILFAILVLPRITVFQLQSYSPQSSRAPPALFL